MKLHQELTFYGCFKSELLELHQLAQVIWPPAFKEILSDEQSKFMLDWMYNMKQLEDQFNRGHLFFLVKENGENIGFVGLEPNYPQKGKLRIHKIYLSFEKQGLKIGKWMLEQVEMLAKQMTLTHLNLNVNRYNNAVKVYEKSGFQIVKSEDIDIGNGYFMNDFVMEKVLN